MRTLQDMIKEFYPFARERMGFDRPVKLILRQDESNASEMLGKTAYYAPAEDKVVLYTSGRHPKDVMRSFSHELVHHAQNCRGAFEEAAIRENGYAQKDEHLREMEREAYEQGNLVFRDWEDGVKYGSKRDETKKD